MKPDAAQPTASAPVEPESFQDYLTQKLSDLRKPQDPSDPSDAPPPADEEKAAPDSDPDKDDQEPKPPSDEEKSQRKQRNDQRRERRWWEERGKIRAENERLRQEVEDLRKRNSPTEPAAVSGKPTLKAFLESGKYKDYEEALEAYQDARDTFNRQAWEQEQSEKSEQTESRTARQAFQTEVREFAKTHPDFDEAFQDVREALESDRGKGNPVTHTILRSKNRTELIYHLGKHPELLDELSGLMEDGDLDGAVDRVVEIRVALGKPPKSEKTATVPDKPKTPVDAPRNPRSVSARNALPSREDTLRKAAEDGDFETFQKANRKKA